MPASRGPGVTVQEDGTTEASAVKVLNFGTGLDLAVANGVATITAEEGGVGATDHGELDGLADDDHPQYHNDARGDARYHQLSTDLATQTELDDVESTLETTLATKADVASPALTGNPTAPTQTQGNDSTRLATTAFVNAEIAADALLKVAGGASVEDVGAIESNVNTVATTGAAETLDTSVYGVHDCTMDQNCTFTFSNPAPSGKATIFVLILRGAFTPTLPASVDWADGTPPTYTTPSIYTFTTVDNGTTWLGQQVGKAFG